MSHCLLKEQDIILFKFFSVSFIFFEIKKISKKKKNAKKNFRNSKNISTQSMSVSENVIIRQWQDLINVLVR